MLRSAARWRLNTHSCTRHRHMSKFRRTTSPIYPTPEDSPAPAHKSTSVQTLMSTIEKFMAHTKHQKHFSMHGRLNGARSLPASHVRAVFETVVRILVDALKLEEAASVYLRMRSEGLVPSTPADVDMVVITMSLSGTHADPDLQSSLFAMVASPDFKEAHCLRVIQLMTRLRFSGHLMYTVIKHFIENRFQPPSSALISSLVRLQTEAGHIAEAMKTLHAFSPDYTDAAGSAAPFSTFLRGMAYTSRHNADAVSDVLHVMSEKSVLPDTGIFNALMERELRNGGWAGAFATYAVLLETAKTSESVQPDPNTFLMLFRAHLAMRRSPSHTRDRTGTKIRNPRMLFNDVLSTFFNPTFPRPPGAFVPAQTLMHLALLVFLACEDYAAAYVCLAAFTHTGQPATALAYKYVLRSVGVRIVEENARAARRRTRWMKAQFGVGVDVLDERSSEVMKDRVAVIKRLLVTCQRPELHLPPVHTLAETPSPVPTVGRNGSDYFVPSYKTIFESDQHPLDPRLASKLSVVPIQRLLRRAILASLPPPVAGEPASSSASDEDKTAQTQSVSSFISHAKDEMLPKGQGLWRPKPDNRHFWKRTERLIDKLRKVGMEGRGYG